MNSTRRAFTLIELMIIVVIIGVLSAMASAGYRHQVARAKTAEPRAMLGAIRRGASVAFEMDWTKSQLLAPGQSTGSTTQSSGSSNSNGNGKGNKGGGKSNGGGNGGGATIVHNPATQLCASADAVPASMLSVKGKKYQSGPEWSEGDAYTGWPCLGFRISGPQYYQYGYDAGAPKVQVTLPKGGNPPGIDKKFTYTAWARGDLDADGRYAWFVTEGAVLSGTLVHASGIGITDETE